RHRGFAGKASADEAPIDQHAPEGPVEAALGRCGIGPEVVQMALMSQPGQIVDSFAYGADGRVLGEGKRRGRAVHTNQASRPTDHFVEVSAIDVVKPPFEAQSPRMAAYEAAPVEEAVVERM